MTKTIGDAIDFDAYLNQTSQELASVEMEQSVLGALLLDNDGIDRIGPLLAEHFARADHRLIFEAVTRMISAGSTADVITVLEQVRAIGKEDVVGGLPYLNALAQNTPGAANIARYAEGVVDRWRLRQMLKAADDIRGEVMNRNGASVGDILSSAQAKFERMGDARGTEPRLLGEYFGELVQELDAQYTGRSTVKATATGYADLDAKLDGGMFDGDLVIVAGRPSMGKTAFALGIAEHVSGNAPAVFFSMEMGGQQIAMRHGARAGGIPMGRLKDGKRLHDGDWPGITRAAQRAAAAKLFIDDRPGLSLFEVQNAARRIKRVHGLGLVVIDYLGLMTGGDGDNRTQQIGSITRGLKGLAKQLGCPIVLLAQLSRAIEQRQNRRPVMADLRDSGEIEQDADTILFIYRDEVYYPDTQAKGVAEIIIGKQRNGALGKVGLAYTGELTRFSDLPPGALWEDARERRSRPRGGFDE
ncbi:replicative DNA helicase [Caballeronia sp. GAFFF2]|uniref:replicative DNA helicase n=1 Tax=Caballeronia sp. GAFFF2 TaxID=2921741 RepID=UPI0020282CCD|nr:replicative DNA helicase [Caballeronia sp. GAFFF2]